ncbi:nuclear transcription factor Y subunit C-3-like [Papaver somniferum]|uniref:nuclear transcription factor Y subunit C-3-like n=1 Tax=Papaver somniferum TaxID=3469 RepID=UPI000E701ED6|nr:nuclear transcription factor Y subunit C-3-like [Papaver somniferum]XP_026438346.1 nuclear transcription factor Y subunit C-3-like [Papaver somniferum]XP_026438347.1 nuclear transcription factor Y subunit C-3-like [Papaver somniferum]
MDQQGHGQPPAVGMVASAGQMPYGTAQYPSHQIIGAPPVGSIQSPGQTAGFSASQAQLVQHQLAYQQAHQHQQQQLQQHLQTFWASQYQEIEHTTDFKNHSLPLARIKKIMKADEDVRMIAAEAPVIFARACEMFILELTLRSWNHTEENKRRTLQKNDIAAAITRTDIFDFLVDIVPREDLKDEGIAMPRAGPVPVGGPSEALSYYYPPQVGAAGMMMGKPVLDPTLYGQQSHPYMPQQVWPQPPAQQQQQQQEDS